MRTRGDASADDFAHLKEAKGRYLKQLQNAANLSEILGVEMESMEEEQVFLRSFRGCETWIKMKISSSIYRVKMKKKKFLHSS